ncbi:hypothetical protein PYW08_009888 [Mythimna loreyi]|uniref:Uncharacterized protein n=1 Tax=Mythimna loreyi TaxID=667449 RepID=A0ACC2Q764_9NEOP|nr:hypothetical protein PYW08_009888 [Mythimna loreyi]
MAHLQYMPGDPHLVDQLVYELKSKGIFDQFRKDCIADVDTRPAYQNLRQRVENSVSSFLSRQVWKPDLNKNQLREKLRKHILDGNYLEQGVERIVDQVITPKVASVFIPQVEDLVYNYLGISRKKAVTSTETSNGKLSTDDLLPEDLEAVSPGSVKSNDDKAEAMDEDRNEEYKMEVDVKDEDKPSISEIEKPKPEGDSQNSVIELNTDSDENTNKSNIPMHEDIKLENIPPPDNSPPKVELENIDIEKIELPKEPNTITEVPHPDEIPLPKDDKEQFFKPINMNSDDDSSSGSSLRRNMSPLTPIRNYNNENSCDAQQAFENDSDSKSNDNKKEPSSFRFAIEAKSPENSLDAKPEKKDPEQANLAYHFNNQVNINTFNTPLYDDSSNSNNLHIDYESDVNSKTNTEKVPEADQNSEDKREKKNDDRKSSHKSSHRSRDSHRHSSSKHKRSDSKQSTSRDSSRHDKKPKDDHNKSKSSHKEREKSRDRGDKKDSRDSSKHRSSSHKSSSSHRDSKSHRSSSTVQKHSSDKKSSDDKKSSSSHKSERSSEKSSDRSSRDKRDSKSSSHRSDKDKKSSSRSKHDEKDKKKDKKETDDHYSLSGRGNNGRRSTDRDSNDGSSSSKGAQNQSGSKTTENKKETKGSSSKSDNTSTSGESTSPSDKDHGVTTASGGKGNQKPIRVENHLETPIASPPRLPFVPDVTLKKPKFAANLEEAKRMMKMRKFLDEEQKRMNQEAALLLEFQANVRPSLSQVYSSIPGPELEFACIANEVNNIMQSKMCKTEPGVDEKVSQESKATVKETDEKDIKTENIKNEDKNKVTNEIIDELEDTLTNNTEFFDEDTKPSEKSETYNENKPFSQLMDEISEYSKASEKNKKDALDNLVDDENKKRTEFFEVTIITEELSESEEPAIMSEDTMEHEIDTTETAEADNSQILENDNTITSEPEISETPTETEITETIKPETAEEPKPETPETAKLEDDSLKYFAEHEKFDAELKRLQYSDFLKAFTERNIVSNKIHIINCDTYEENLIKEVCETFGTFEVINYYKNGHLKLPKTVVKNVNVASEISLPVDSTFGSKSPSPVFSPVKSECSFELSSDYDAKLEEMVNKTSRQEVMEIILGSVIDDENPSIDYCTESSIDNELHLKRKLTEVDSAENNNRQVLKKVRKMSDSDQISSTTEESEEVSNNNRVSHPTRSKYLGRARRVGLARPRRNNLPNSPSSDKSVENYEQNTQTATQTQTPNGKFKSLTRSKVQRYDTSDLYKPKLHYLSRRNNIS